MAGDVVGRAPPLRYREPDGSLSPFPPGVLPPGWYEEPMQYNPRDYWRIHNERGELMLYAFVGRLEGIKYDRARAVASMVKWAWSRWGC